MHDEPGGLSTRMVRRGRRRVVGLAEERFEFLKCLDPSILLRVEPLDVSVSLKVEHFVVGAEGFEPSTP
jgi:hypothetical protein